MEPGFPNCDNREVYRAFKIGKTIKRAFDGALTPMMQFLLENENFSDEDLKQLRKIVNKAGSKNK